jgi:hypothetical protein
MVASVTGVPRGRATRRPPRGGNGHYDVEGRAVDLDNERLDRPAG